MPPELMTFFAALLGAGSSYLNGSPGEQKSSYSEGAQNSLSEAQQMLSQMKGGADVRQNQGYGTGMDWLQSLFNDPEFFKNFEAPARRQFEEEIIPGVANRFASEGSGGSLGSTGFRNQIAREGSNLSTNLAALRGGMQQGAIPQLLNYAQQPAQNYLNLLGPATQPTQNIYQPPSAGGFADLMSMFSGAAAGGLNFNSNSPGTSPSTNPGISGASGKVY